MSMGFKVGWNVFIVVVSVLLGLIPASGNQRPIVTIQVMGNDKIESAAILDQVESKEGDPLSFPALRNDIQRIYGMGYFTDVQIDVKDTTEGPLVTFVVVEKPSIGQIVITGNEKIETSKIQEKIDISLYSIVKTDKIQEIIEEIIKLYLSKGYHGAKVTYRIEPLEKNEVILEIIVDEGKKGSIRKVVFKGNKRISSRKLRGRMKTKKRTPLSLIMGTGYLDEDVLNNDLDVLKGFYYDEGYLRVKIEKPRVIVGKKGKSITIEITVDEGPRFKTEGIDFTGDILTTEEDLLAGLKTEKGKVYRNTVVQQDLLKLTDLYADQGYANVDVRPTFKLDDERNAVYLTFEIDKGEKVYFERIGVAGNTKTRDKVIRRELRFGEGDLFTSTGLRRSRQRLKTTGYFAEVDFRTSRGSSEEKLNLDVEVEEAPTGAFSVGAGFSTKDQFIIDASVSERNFLGLGYQLLVKGALGGETSDLRFSFTDPWLLGYPVSAGIDVYATEESFFDSYSTDVRGGRLSLGKELGEYLEGSLSYTYERTKVFDVAPEASPLIKEQEGERDSSILGAFLSADNRDDYFSPTRGGIYRLGAENSGGPLGGDIDFYRFTGQFQYYQPVFWEIVGHVRFLLGVIDSYGGQDVPIYERFYVGGIRTIRGFDYGEAGPEDENEEVIGAENEAVANFEILFPLSKEMGLRGVVFLDVGKGFDRFDDLLPLRAGAGVGIRWLTPLGPFRIDYGWNLDPRDNEVTGRLHFFIGGPL
jgi:outer membrane protein insertion porin family